MPKSLVGLEWVDDQGNTQGTNDSNVVLGYNATLPNYAYDTVLIGQGATSGNYMAVSIGGGAYSDSNAVAIGRKAGALEGSIVVGEGAKATHYAVALGQQAIAGRGDVAVGCGATANSDDYSVAIGDGANADRGGIAIGFLAEGETGCVVVGRSSTSVGWAGTAIGDRAFTSMNAVALGAGANASVLGVSIGRDAHAGSNGIAIGGHSLAQTNSGAIAIGEGAMASMCAVAIGLTAQSRPNSITIGGPNYFRAAYRSNQVIVGVGSNSDGSYSVVVGNNSHADAERDIIIGYGSSIGENSWGQHAVVIGPNVTVYNSPGLVYLGQGNISLSNYTNSVILGDYNTEQLICSATAITHFSDSRLKEEITEANVDQCLEDVARLPVKRYKYKNFVGRHRDVHRTGFMADDVANVFPKDVYVHPESEYEDRDENGNLIMEAVLDENGNQVIEDIINPTTGEAIPTPKYRPRKIKLENVKMISMEMAIPTLWGAVQALNNKNQQLEQSIEEIRKEIELLKNK